MLFPYADSDSDTLDNLYGPPRHLHPHSGNVLLDKLLDAAIAALPLGASPVEDSVSIGWKKSPEGEVQVTFRFSYRTEGAERR